MKIYLGNIIGESPKIKKIFEIISNVSNTEANILIQGETAQARSWWQGLYTIIAHGRTTHSSK